MTQHAAPLRCPFCQTELAARDEVCRGCQARKHVRTGMSPRGFRWYVTAWLVVSVPLMLLATFIALVPWLPHGETPGYALALVGARPAEVVPRCRVEVVDAAGRRTASVVDAPCGTQAVSAPASAGREDDQTTRRMAAAVHSGLTLAAGVLLCWGLLHLLRRPFLRRAAPSWVRRAAA